MALRMRPIVTGIATLLFTGYVSALGLGEIKLNSALNEPLDAEIPLLNLGELTEDELIAGLASNKDFMEAGVEKELILTDLKFNLDLTAAGGPALRIQSRKPIREPYLDFLVDIQWPAGRLLREYTLLLDLPVYAGGESSKKKIKEPVTQRSAGSPSTPTDTGSSSAYARQPDIKPGDEEYLVRRGDTLWSIASNLESGATIHQRMGALLQLNPDAFINGDINLLKRGAVLRIPDNATMTAMPASRGSGTADPSLFAPQVSGSTRQSPAVSQGDSRGRLTLEAEDVSSKGGSSQGSGEGNLSGLRGELSSLEEELDKTRRENSELRQRLTSLEEQITTMQKLLELGDDNLRAVQLSQMSEGEPAEVAAPSDQDIPGETAEVQTPDAESPSLALFPGADSSATKPGRTALGDGETPEDTVSGMAPEAGDEVAGEAPSVEQEPVEIVPETSEETVQKTEPAPAPASKMAVKTEKGWIDRINDFLPALIGLVVVLVGAVVFFALRSRKSEEEDDYDSSFEEYMPLAEDDSEEETWQTAAETKASSIDDIELDEADDLFSESSEKMVSGFGDDTESAVAESPEDMDLDLSAYDLEDSSIESGEVEFDEEDDSALYSSAVAENLNLDEEFDFLGDIDEGDTQLELAQAYIEMGDQSGAREILQEVAEGGNDEQKEKARQLLHELS